MAYTENSVGVLAAAWTVSLNALRKGTENQKCIVSFYGEKNYPHSKAAGRKKTKRGWCVCVCVVTGAPWE